MGKPLEQDPEYLRRIASGELAPPAADAQPKAPTRAGKLSALLFLGGVLFIISAGIFSQLRPQVMVDGRLVGVDLAQLIQITMLTVAAMTTSQSSATFAIIPIGIALGLEPATLAAMWPAVVGVFLLPTNGSQIATVELDRTGSTRIGSAVINHSFLVPTLLYAVVAVGLGLLISRVAGGGA